MWVFRFFFFFFCCFVFSFFFFLFFCFFLLQSPRRATGQPWRCLCLCSLQMTRTTPWRRSILQLRHTRLSDACSFILIPLHSIFIPPPTREARRGLAFNAGRRTGRGP